MPQTDPKLLPFVIINFLIVAVLVGKLLFKPVIEAIQKRQTAVDDVSGRLKAEEARIQELETMEDRLQQEVNERKKLVKEEIAAFSENYRQEKLAEQDEELAELKRQALEELNEERRYTAASYQDYYIELSTLLTEKLLKRCLTDEEKSRSVDLFIESLEDMSAGSEPASKAAFSHSAEPGQ